VGRIALLLTFAGAPLAADAVLSGLTNDEIARRAEQEFKSGVELRGARDKAIPHFQIASECFEELRRRGVRNPDLYRNLGNASLLADDLPRALLSYRRGLRLAPTDPDLQAGLTEARGRVVYATTGGFGRPPDDYRPPWLPRLGSAGLFAGAAVCYVAGCLCATRWLMTRRGWPLVSGVIALLTAVTLTTLMVAAVRSEREEREHPLVVVAEDGVLLRKGDGLAYPSRYETPLNKGVEARRLYERGDWSQIELSGGEIGWVRRDWLLVDEP
jgi:tetratricopeptide (TPR) repeat protein